MLRSQNRNFPYKTTLAIIYRMRRKLLIIFTLLLLISCSKGELIDSEKSKSYFIKSNNIYYSPNGNWIAFGYDKCNADLKTFEILTNSIAKDSKSIYLGHNEQKQVDYKTFRIDSNGIPKDKNNVYEYDVFNLKTVEIKDIDVETFEYLQENKSSMYSWTKDKNNYYFDGRKLNVDYKSLKFINEDFFYDKDYLYSDLNDWKIIEISEIKQPPIKINEKYILSNNTCYFVGRDKKNRISLISKKIESYQNIKSISKNVILIDSLVYTFGTKYEPLNPKTFKKVEINFYTFKTLSESDFESELAFNYYCDKDNVYFNNFIVENANPKTLQILGLGFSKDDNFVFYNANVLKGVDTKSFRKVEKNLIWKDNFGNEFDYYGNKKL
jgi:hypothetical protein